MENRTKPSTEDLRKAQLALNAVNVAYEYFAPETPKGGTAQPVEYFEYVAAA